MKNKRYMKNQFGVLQTLCGLVAIAAQMLFGGHSKCIAANTYDAAVDTRKHVVRTNDAAIATRHLIYKEGSTAGTGAAVCGAADKPLGTIDNIETDTGIAQNVMLFGIGDHTRKVVASEAITIGQDIYTAASGKVQNQPAAAGSYYKIGRALTAAAADGDVIEIEPFPPQLYTWVANAASLATTQAAMTGGAIVQVL